MAREPRFELTGEDPSVETLVVGVSAYGLAGLTAVDYLTDQTTTRQIGHLAGGGPPPITPFQEGRPRHHTRVDVVEDSEIGVVVGERMVTVESATDVAGAIEDLAARLDCTAIVILSGVPVAHGPEDHVPFYIATDDYREQYLTDTELRPMGNGFLDGLPAALVDRGIETDDFGVAVFTTPVHAQAPDAAAAIRLLDALTTTHGVDIDTGPLEAFAANVESHYRALADRLEEADEELMPDDRMYM